MAYKIMGVTAGRKNSNSEILLKEALMACEELGAEVRMINLKDFHIEPCTGCTSCTRGMAQGKNTGCVLDNKDDKKKIMDVLLNQDAVIYSAPTYDLMPNAEYLAFAQRSLAFETSFLETIGAIEHRDRVAGLIAVGGSTRAWQSIALECMQATMFTTDFKVVDMILGTRIPGRAQCLLNDEHKDYNIKRWKIFKFLSIRDAKKFTNDFSITEEDSKAIEEKISNLNKLSKIEISYNKEQKYKTKFFIYPDGTIENNRLEYVNENAMTLDIGSESKYEDKF